MLWATIAVILDFDIKADIMGYTGYTNEKDKPELIRLIISGIIGIGVIATILRSVVKFLWQPVLLDKQNKLAEERRIQERFNVATTNFGDKESVSVRIASFNEFYHIAEIELDRRKNIFDILCARLWQITKCKNYKPKEMYFADGIKESNPTKEVQNLLDILFKPKNKGVLIFSSLEANLAEANLQGANLQEANLQGVNLQGVNLQKANLRYANLQEANLQEANLRYADLQEANLEKANLQDAKMQRANLQEANLQEANLQKANLQRADLQRADLLGAEINEATTVMPDNWDKVVKLYDNKDGTKTPMVKVMNSKGEVEKVY